MRTAKLIHRTWAAVSFCVIGACAALADETKLPPIAPLFDYPVRDTSICIGGDGMYYLTGTTGYPTWWKTNEGIRVWKSADLKTWAPLGLVWKIDEGTWQKVKHGDNRALWAPEIHYLRGTFWLTFCMNFGGTGLLKSESGKPEGPYVDVHPQGPLTGEIDAALFADDDGKVYFVHQNGKIARMNDDMTELAEKPRLLKPSNADHVGFEGAFLCKIDGRYALLCAEFNDRLGTKTYDCMIATAENVYGPYGPRYLAIPHGGHNMLFRDKAGQWWSTFFGNDPKAPFRERPAILRIALDKDGRVHGEGNP
ncbi:MAG: family 43 glycosylhydrolase [Pirellulales bacterium]|nr:family 43 glycosylhydrolase [Pirellulales bacterium]